MLCIEFDKEECVIKYEGVTRYDAAERAIKGAVNKYLSQKEGKRRTGQLQRLESHLQVMLLKLQTAREMEARG
jgi:hypothetical protein